MSGDWETWLWIALLAVVTVGVCLWQAGVL